MIYFIGGLKHREFKYFEILEQIRKEAPNILETVFDASLKEEDRFLEKISMNSIFSVPEIVILKRTEKLKNIEKLLEYIESLNIQNKEIIIDYLKEDGKLGSKLIKKLEELKQNGDFKVYLYLKYSDDEMRDYICHELGVSKRDAMLLIEMVGKNPFKIKNEVGKIKAYLGGDNFVLEEVKKIVSIEKEFQIYQIVREILTNNVLEAMDYLKKTKEYMGVLYSLYGELEAMYKISSLKKEGKVFSSNYNVFKKQFEEYEDIFKNNGRIPNPYVIYKKLGIEKNYTKDNLKRLVYRCWEVERDIKTGKIEMAPAVENLILEIISCFKVF